MTTETNPPTVPIRATVVAGRWPNVPFVEIPGVIPNGTFPPSTATLITGATEAVLIDAMHLIDEVQDLGDLIERTGKKLTTIYITHDHADHYLGAGPLLKRFPEAKLVALPQVIESMKETMEAQTGQWHVLFGDTSVAAGPLPEPLEGDTLWVDGSAVRVIEVKQADIHPSSIVHVPEIDLVVAGDAIYNEIHPMLGLATPSEWQDWLETITLIESLQPKMLVAGHRRPDGDDRAVDTMISETRSYIHDFQAAFNTATSIEELVGTMTMKYPHHGNIWSLMFSAASAIGVREGGPSVTEAVMAAMSS